MSCTPRQLSSTRHSSAELTAWLCVCLLCLSFPLSVCLFCILFGAINSRPRMENEEQEKQQQQLAMPSFLHCHCFCFKNYVVFAACCHCNMSLEKDTHSHKNSQKLRLEVGPLPGCRCCCPATAVHLFRGHCKGEFRPLVEQHLLAAAGAVQGCQRVCAPAGQLVSAKLE